MVETPHFQIGHMCAGCKISNYSHTGCIVDQSVRIVKTETKKSPVNVQNKVVFVNTKPIISN